MELKIDMTIHFLKGPDRIIHYFASNKVKSSAKKAKVESSKVLVKGIKG